MHASIQCGIVPSNVTRYSVSTLQQELSILHFSVARCIVSIMANTSLVSETLLTERAIFSDALQAYTCTCSYYTCKYSRLLLWHIAAPGSRLFICFEHVTDLQYLLDVQVQLQVKLTSNSAPCFQLTNSKCGPYVWPECTNER